MLPFESIGEKVLGRLTSGFDGIERERHVVGRATVGLDNLFEYGHERGVRLASGPVERIA